MKSNKTMRYLCNIKLLFVFGFVFYVKNIFYVYFPVGNILLYFFVDVFYFIIKPHLWSFLHLGIVFGVCV